MSILEQQYEALFTPWKVGNVEIKNRIVMCPMGGTSLFGWFELTGCHFDKEAAKLFLERANNNVGLIIPGIAPLRDTFWGKWLWQNPKMFEDLAVFMDEIHKTGAKLFIQLTAGMGRSWAITDSIVPLHKNAITRKLIKPVLDTSHELASPSPQPSRWAHDIECPEITVSLKRLQKRQSSAKMLVWTEWKYTRFTKDTFLISLPSSFSTSALMNMAVTLKIDIALLRRLLKPSKKPAGMITLYLCVIP